MLQSDGVIAETNDKGEIIQVTIDVQKHRELAKPALKYLRAAEKSRFMQEFEQGHTIEETRDFLYKHIDEIWKSSYQ